MARRPLSDEQISVLRRILTGDHPSPGADFLGWPQHNKPNAKFFAIVMFNEQASLGLQVDELKQMRKIFRKR